MSVDQLSVGDRRLVVAAGVAWSSVAAITIAIIGNFSAVTTINLIMAFSMVGLLIGARLVFMRDNSTAPVPSAQSDKPLPPPLPFVTTFCEIGFSFTVAAFVVYFVLGFASAYALANLVFFSALYFAVVYVKRVRAYRSHFRVQKNHVETS